MEIPGKFIPELNFNCKNSNNDPPPPIIVLIP